MRFIRGSKKSKVIQLLKKSRFIRNSSLHAIPSHLFLRFYLLFYPRSVRNINKKPSTRRKPVKGIYLIALQKRICTYTYFLEKASIKRMGDEQKKATTETTNAMTMMMKAEREREKQEKSECLCTQHYTLLFYYSVRNESKQIELQFSKKMGQLIISLLCLLQNTWQVRSTWTEC